MVSCDLCMFLLVWFSVVRVLFVFFFKQKTAYEMRISDWSSDVCSSDLSIGEPGTQLTMRTFHIGGAANFNETSNLEAMSDGTIELRDMPTITDKNGRRLSLARNGEIAIIDSEGRERETHRLPYGATILFADGDEIGRAHV